MELSERMTTWPAWRFYPLFFAGAAIVAGGALWSAQNALKLPIGPSVTFFGAIVACCGVLTIGRPVIRVGGYLNWYRQKVTFDGGHFEPTPEEIEESRQGQMDAIVLQIIGPALVIAGTMLGGAG